MSNSRGNGIPITSNRQRINLTSAYRKRIAFILGLLVFYLLWRRPFGLFIREESTKLHASDDASLLLVNDNGTTVERSDCNQTGRYFLGPDFCSDDLSSHPYLLLIIPSRPGNAKDRAAVRETWGLHARKQNVALVFGFGAFGSTNDDLHRELRSEHAFFGDLLQITSITDAYHNQTQLMLAFLDWGAKNCQSAQFIGKADEDTWINIFGVLERLRPLENETNFILGHIITGAVVRRLATEKWALTLQEYPDATYPPFAEGHLYIFPRSSITSVLQASKRLHMHWIDDVFIGGQIPKFLNMSLIHIPEWAQIFDINPKSRDCSGSKYLIIHDVSAVVKRKIYYHPCMRLYRQIVPPELLP
ncbi:putative Lactosylceramide 1,3-N-acetyl-beta-D-glucosaminyltransferase A [Hypsibius exemplaris]|uniref:Hexosyltransferase n=1 Tax=Hypsibius exemplaris TaxID=2072580 RepID=A0A1W0WQ88_HYPEX|nr:putative Lactosylceramide 1,3-N-acetyl-beta-D-glucosaminyltransferase A [Hypsibius exemplaris]